jgi:hypothetical protein
MEPEHDKLYDRIKERLTQAIVARLGFHFNMCTRRANPTRCAAGSDLSEASLETTRILRLSKADLTLAFDDVEANRHNSLVV